MHNFSKTIYLSSIKHKPIIAPGAIVNADIAAIQDDSLFVVGMLLFSASNCGNNTAENPIVSPHTNIPVSDTKATRN